MLASLAALSFEWVGLAKTERRAEELMHGIAPLVGSMKEVPTVVYRLREALGDIETATTEKELLRIAGMFASIETHIGEGQAFRGRQWPGFGATDPGIFATLLDLQRRIINERSTIEGLVSNEVLRVEEMSWSVQTKLARALLQISRGEPEPDKADALVELSALDKSVGALLIWTRSLRDAQPAAARAMKPQVVRELDAMTSHLSRLSDQDLRRGMARQISAYRDALLGPGRGFELIGSLETATEERDDAVRRATRQIDAMVTWSERSASDAAAAFRETAEQNRATIASVRRFDIMANLVFWSGCMLIMWLLVERKLIARLERLVAHIRVISAGDLDREVAVTGEDEVGELERVVDHSRLMARSLAEKNKDLERFAYVAAHDLRAPLRAISDVVGWTKEDFGPILPEQVRQNLDLIDNRTARLSDHLNGLLAYARAGQSEAELGTFDLECFAADMQDQYVTRRNFRIVVDGTPPLVRTYTTPVTTILLNLVTNAIRHHDLDAGLVTLSFTREDDRVVYSVADDGPGIRPEYQERIFGLFQTLKPRDEVEGSGIGLALVEKLAASLEGGVTVRSDPDTERGAIFQLWLPLSKTAWLLETRNEAAA